MLAESFLEIPRIFTSIAEFTACLIYIIPLRKRYTGIRHFVYLTLGPIAIIIIQLVSGELPLMFWIPGMLAAVMAMFLYVFIVCDLSGYDAGFIFVRAFILAEFVAAVEWQIYYYFLYKGIQHSWWLATFVMISVYVPIFAFVYWIDARKVDRERQMAISLRELVNALIIGVATFSINNLNFIIDSPFVVRQVGANLLYIRTLVDFSGLLLLFAWNEQRREIQMNHELKAMNDILYKHYDHYQASQESMDIINQRYHDLKHQINMIRAEKDPVKREEYLSEIDHAMGVFKSQYNTGNKVVDTMLTGKSLYCNQNNINLSCVVNGELLDFMLVMDICSIFGNALDNSIESVLQLEDDEKRIIRVAVYSKNNFLMIRFENYYEHEVKFHDGSFYTTKEDSSNHGYGIKSIKKTIEKYDGNLTISTDNNWFIIKILIPLSRG